MPAVTSCKYALKSVAAARKISPNWSQERMTCHSEFQLFCLGSGKRTIGLVRAAATDRIKFVNSADF